MVFFSHSRITSFLGREQQNASKSEHTEYWKAESAEASDWKKINEVKEYFNSDIFRFVFGNEKKNRAATTNESSYILLHRCTEL